MPLLISDLGLTKEEAQEIRNRLLSFEEDWNAPGMEVYDEIENNFSITQEQIREASILKDHFPPRPEDERRIITLEVGKNPDDAETLKKFRDEYVKRKSKL